MVCSVAMLRLAIFLGVVVLLFHAGTRQVGPTPSQAAAGAERQTFGNTRIAGPAIADNRAGALVLPTDDAAMTPVPFDLSEIVTDDPRRLPGALRLDKEGEFWSVAVPNLALRTGPSQLYPALATLARGVSVISAGVGTGDWLWVRAEDASHYGYAAARLLSRKD